MTTLVAQPDFKGGVVRRAGRGVGLKLKRLGPIDYIVSLNSHVLPVVDRILIGSAGGMPGSALAQLVIA